MMRKSLPLLCCVKKNIVTIHIVIIPINVLYEKADMLSSSILYLLLVIENTSLPAAIRVTHCLGLT
ncbi:hypothetical protein V1478_016431 [Vespula squamosa]|uniref:Uncharacterized protein n=1 Tax=Vespula squamosa TaxID=30214 RepID=A0ABD1ZZT8_VESSQ